MKIKTILIFVFLGAANIAKCQIDTIRPRKLFIYNSFSTLYFPRLKPVDVSHPELLYRFPAIFHGLDVIGVSKELYDGKYSVGLALGMVGDEWGAMKGMLISDSLSAPSNYQIGYLCDRIYNFYVIHPYMRMELDRRINLSNRSDLTIGVFVGLNQKYPGTSRSTSFPLRLDGIEYNVSPYQYGAKIGWIKNNWELSLMIEKFQTEGDYVLYSLDNQISGLYDTYSVRDHYLNFQIRYYYGRKRYSSRYQ